MGKVIDLPRIQAALKKLDQIAADHPEICGGGGTWTEEAVAEMIRQKGGTPAKQRVAAYRQRLAEQGIKREIFFASPEAQTALAQLREMFQDKTRDQIFNDAILNLLAVHRPELHPITESVSRNHVENLELFSAETESTTRPAINADRDQQILEWHRQGLSNYAVADKAGCSEATVRRTLKRVPIKEATQ